MQPIGVKVATGLEVCGAPMPAPKTPRGGPAPPGAAPTQSAPERMGNSAVLPLPRSHNLHYGKWVILTDQWVSRFTRRIGRIPARMSPRRCVCAAHDAGKIDRLVNARYGQRQRAISLTSRFLRVGAVVCAAAGCAHAQQAGMRLYRHSECEAFPMRLGRRFHVVSAPLRRWE